MERQDGRTGIQFTARRILPVTSTLLTFIQLHVASTFLYLLYGVTARD